MKTKKPASRSYAKAAAARLREQKALLATLLAALSAGSAKAALNWSDATVAAGDIVGKTDGTTTTVVQGSDKGVINWNGFNLDATDVMNLLNGAAGQTLIRDVNTTSAVSSILGTINATGSLFIANPNGVIIGSGAAINVGQQFLAAAADINPADFMNGTYKFTVGTGEVWNVGAIKAGADVILVGAKVVNAGTVQAADQIAFGGFGKTPVTVADNVAGGSISFALDSVATGGTVVNTGTVQNAAGPAIAITAATGSFTARKDDGTGTGTVTNVSVADIAGDPTFGINAAAGSAGPAAVAGTSGIDIQSAGDVELGSSGTVSGGAVTIDATGNVGLVTNHTAPAGSGLSSVVEDTLAGALSAANGSIDVDGATVTLAGATAGTDVTIDGTGQVTLTGAVSGASVAVKGTGVDAAGQTLMATGGDLTVNGQTGDVTTGTLSATGNVDVDGAAVTVAGVTDGAAVTIDGTGQVTLTGNVNGATVAVTGTGVDATGQTLTATAGDLTVNGKTGDVTAGTLSATGNVDVDGATVTVAGVTDGTDVTIDGTGQVTVGAVTSDSAEITTASVLRSMARRMLPAR